MVETMFKLTGVDHTVTASYNPRCNGLTERMNQTLINMLRKYCATNPTTWHYWLPFVMMCYRTRVHSVTKHTPFKLMFGREHNLFHNYDVEITDRLEQLRNLSEVIYPEVKLNIEHGQDHQKEVQNKAHNILPEHLTVGTRVMVKNESLVPGKLDARYSNKCTVIGVDELDN